MKHVILGTAGHIDHGKTALVKALTGVDTDRLKEEKARGITIELGFTFLDLPSGIRLGIIDVPGHERFIRHMVAGVWGIDLVALIIAADEGVMPQTREHLDICNLLKVKKGLIVLTKSDLVDRELLDLVKEDVVDLVRNTFLEGAPILPVSSVTGQGIPELTAAMDGLSNEVEERSSDGLFRLPVDRVFVMKGFGTVVTGTVVSGTLSLGETVQILPSGLEGKIRNLQVYNQPVEKSYAGQRTAVNLQGVEASDVARGDVVVYPGTLSSTRIIDAFFEYLPTGSHPLKHRVKHRFHIGTHFTSASIFLLDREELLPGEAGFVQLRLDRPVVALPEDRFVILGTSEIQTIGGGRVLDTRPTKHKRYSPSMIKDLTVLAEGSGKEIMGQHIFRSGAGGIEFGELLTRVALPVGEVEAILHGMATKGEVQIIDPEKRKIVAASQYELLKEKALGQLKEFHQKSPMKSGLAKEEMRTKLPADVDPRLFQMILAELIQSKEVVVEKDKVRLPEHQISAVDEKGLLKLVEGAILQGGLQPNSSKELSEQWGEKEGEIQAVLEHLVHGGVLVKIRSGMFFHQTHIEKLKEKVVAHLKNHHEITTPQFKEITGVSRKYAIPLIEYFDQIRLTLRLGDKRVLRATLQGGERMSS